MPALLRPVPKGDIGLNALSLEGPSRRKLSNYLPFLLSPMVAGELAAQLPYTQILTYWECVVFPLIESGTK